jgi:TetR/AcrR family transcriptional regulator, transcriptional repressor for nem operon
MRMLQALAWYSLRGRIESGSLRRNGIRACTGAAVTVLRFGFLFGMICIMRNSTASLRATAKEASHERIVGAAARAIRRSGYDGTGVADIMKEAGLTHGAFYAHFASREAMLAEAADRAGAESNALAASVLAAAPSDQGLKALMQVFLSKEHVVGIETGCPISALGSEMPRQSPQVRSAATRRIKEMIDQVARQFPDWGQPSAHERALVSVATMVGTLILARAVNDSALSDALCKASLKSLVVPADATTS